MDNQNITNLLINNTYLPTISYNTNIINNITPLPTILNYTNYNVTVIPTVSAILNYSYYNIVPEHSDISLFNYTQYVFFLNDNSYDYLEIPNIGSKTIPKNSSDIITFEDIVDGDILIDFLRDTKTEYEYGVYYKESTLDAILKSRKNQFTMEQINIKSIVKYRANII